jgi:predicted nucleic acid-binding protein
MQNELSSEVTELTRLDHIILQNGGKTVNTERLPIFLQISKNERSPTLEELQFEVGRLRQEVALHQEAQKTLMKLFNDTIDVYQLLREALRKAASRCTRDTSFLELAYNVQDAGLMIQESLHGVSEKLTISESKFLQTLGISLDDTKGKDFSLF